jgi:hypothetical protein
MNTNLNETTDALKILVECLIEELSDNDLINKTSLNTRINERVKNIIYVDFIQQIQKNVNTVPKSFLNTNIIGDS